MEDTQVTVEVVRKVEIKPHPQSTKKVSVSLREDIVTVTTYQPGSITPGVSMSRAQWDVFIAAIKKQEALP